MMMGTAPAKPVPAPAASGIGNLRKPSMQQSLRTLLDAGVEIHSVVDVGVLSVTAPLLEVFPDRKHYLFEPIESYLPRIRKNYEHIDHDLLNIALSDTDGELFLASTSLTGDGNITHSHIVEHEVTRADIPSLVSCKKIRRARLDSIVAESAIEGPLLIKIDVDGHELAVLAGAEETLKLTSVVVIEAPVNRQGTSKFFDRANFLLDHGFVLMDIVDLSYYDGILWQVDLVFVREEVAHRIDRLRPFEREGFEFEGGKWFALNEDKFKRFE